MMPVLQLHPFVLTCSDQTNLVRKQRASVLTAGSTSEVPMCLCSQREDVLCLFMKIGKLTLITSPQKTTWILGGMKKIQTNVETKKHIGIYFPNIILKRT